MWRCVAIERLRAPAPPPDIDYLFAPLKGARLDYLAQKATEMGVAPPEAGASPAGRFRRA